MLRPCALLAVTVMQSLALIDNGIEEQPVVSCLAHHIKVSFNTKKPFKGHVFVRDYYNTAECHQDYVLHNGTQGGLDVQFDQCGMRKQRETNPRGIKMSTVVVVSFHRQFITQLDRAYQIDCFYVEQDKAVTQMMGVSALPTTAVAEHSPPEPSCRYQVLDAPGGQPITFARVGERVYHKWSCDYPMDDMYCMLVHSCNVDSGHADTIHKLIDTDGCSTDSYILADLAYATDLHAGTESNVFKMADKSNVYFTCQIRLSLKSEHPNRQCPRPQCHDGNSLFAAARRRRSAPAAVAVVRAEDVDVTAGRLFVHDIDQALPLANAHNTNNPTTRLQSLDDEWLGTGIGSSGQLCLSPLSFGLFIAAAALSCLTALAFLALYVCRSQLWYKL